jgi:3-hydroxyacyl-CoA dehydrogenase/3-hydroxy-2-methylbutyryl-CoA dehydrogenase
MNLRGRSAPVAGGAGGLGAATVHRLAGCGMYVVVLDRAPDGSRAGGHALGSASVLVDGDVNEVGTFNVVRLAATAMGTTHRTTTGSGGYWSTPRRWPASRGRAARWPTGPPRPPFWG